MASCYLCDRCGRPFAHTSLLIAVEKNEWVDVAYLGKSSQQWKKTVEMWCNRCTATIMSRHA